MSDGVARAGRGSERPRRSAWRDDGGGKRDETNVRLSKRISWILRHGAAGVGLPIRDDGFVLVSDLLAVDGFRGLTLGALQEIVYSDSKGRYTLQCEGGASAGMGAAEDADGTNGSGGGGDGVVWLIRANQGHSIAAVADEGLLTPIADPSEAPVCVHGTYRRHWPAIRAEGLRRMSRNHIHFAAGMPGTSGVISGMRGRADLLVFADVGAAMAAGLRFYRSDNGVLLTRGDAGGALPSWFFDRVVDLTQDGEVIFRGSEDACQPSPPAPPAAGSATAAAAAAVIGGNAAAAPLPGAALRSGEVKAAVAARNVASAVPRAAREVGKMPAAMQAAQLESSGVAAETAVATAVGAGSMRQRRRKNKRGNARDADVSQLAAGDNT